jgi:(1->4)-alpha-D-glucan 1-alpha-D-glucosylmutase
MSIVSSSARWRCWSTMVEPRPVLEHLRRLRGIAPGFHDYRGAWHELGVDSLRRLLAALGHDVSDEAALARDADALAQRDWVRVLPPVVVRRQHDPVPFTVLAPLPATVHWRIETEQGDTHFGEVRPDRLQVLAERGIQQLWYVRLALELPALAAGYHRLWLEKDDGSVLGSTRLAAVPERCHQPEFLQQGERSWGAAIQLYTLRSPRNWGIGDFTDLAGFGAAVASLGADFVGINPLHAMFPADPEACAPYSPSSRRYLNVLYIDPEAIEEFPECPDARRLVALPEFQDRLEALRAAPMIDYAGVTGCKLDVLRPVFEWFEASASRARRLAFDRFLQREGQTLEHFALFHALHAHFTAGGQPGGWPAWPASYHDPGGPAAQAFRDAEAQAVRFHSWLQWIAREQLDAAEARVRDGGLRLGLYRDLAVGPAGGGAETWGEDAPYARDVSVGAPPDSLAPQGQDWGVPPFAPDALRENGYEPFIRLLRANMGIGGALRLDHVMALMRLWWVARDGPSAEGAYVHYPFDDLMGIVALESRRQQCLVIGEDLGTVPPEVREAMARHGVYSYRVLLFERESDGAFKPAEAYPREALVTAATHDLPPLLGFWRGADIDLRERLGLYASPADPESERSDREEARSALRTVLSDAGLLSAGEAAGAPDEAIVAAAQCFLAGTPAALLALQPEEWLGMQQPVNVPGTHEHYPNWRRKLAAEWPELMSRAKVRQLLEDVARRRKAGAGQL